MRLAVTILQDLCNDIVLAHSAELRLKRSLGSVVWLSTLLALPVWIRQLLSRHEELKPQRLIRPDEEL